MLFHHECINLHSLKTNESVPEKETSPSNHVSFRDHPVSRVFVVNSSIRIPPPDLIGQVFFPMFPPGGLYSREVDAPGSEIIGFSMLLTF